QLRIELERGSIGLERNGRLLGLVLGQVGDAKEQTQLLERIGDRLSHSLIVRQQLFTFAVPPQRGLDQHPRTGVRRRFGALLQKLLDGPFVGQAVGQNRQVKRRSQTRVGDSRG